MPLIPVEIAKAFNAPLMSCGEALANESDFLKRFGKTHVKSGFVTLNSTRTLGMNAPREVQMPERGDVYQA
jgi:hypothetical protein